MKKGLTELIFILDRSGSMCGLEDDTIGGYNGLLAKQRKDPGEAIITTILFDDQYELLHDRINLRGVAPITGEEYYVRGCTALLDAVGKAVNKIKNVYKHIAETERAEQVMFVIVTDGYENASREYTFSQVRNLIEEQKKIGWEFIFLGANINVAATAQEFGINRDRSSNYCADSEGTQRAYEAIDKVVRCVRAMDTIDDNWNTSLEKDVKASK